MVGFAGPAVIESIKRKLISVAKLLDLKSFAGIANDAGVLMNQSMATHRSSKL
jgi:hypothetical protein